MKPKKLKKIIKLVYYIVYGRKINKELLIELIDRIEDNKVLEKIKTP